MFRSKIGLIPSLPVLLLVLVSVSIIPAEAAIDQPTSATAVFNLNGVTGWVRFFHDNPQPLADVLVNLQGLTQDADWSIRQFPVDETLSPSDRCSDDYLGTVFNPNGAPIMSNPDCSAVSCPVGDLSLRLRPINQMGIDWFNETDNALNRFTLQGSQSIIGRSLLLEIGSKRVCSTIRSKAGGDVTILQATFISPVAGTIYFRQNGDEPTVIHGNLFWVNGTATAASVEWTIYDDLLEEIYRVGECGTPTMIFDDLTGRHGMINVDVSPLPYSEEAFLFTNDTLKLTSGIDGRSLILSQGGSIIACAPIVISESVETFQYPEFDVRISQSSPYENSTLVQSAGFKADSAYTILSAAWMTSGLCPLTDEVYNPLGVTAPPSDVFRTPDTFEYGNISGKFGSVLGPSQSLRFPELPMYGAFSMLGLTLRAVSTNQGAPYRICSALVPLKDDNTLLAKATFTQGSVRGAIYFLQRQDPEFSGEPGVTNIIVDLYLNDGTASKMSAWNIQDTTCSASLGSNSYNPFGVERGATYAAQCTINSPLRCENGDLTGKHGELSIGPLGVSRNTYAFIDSNLQLDQTYKIIGRSLGVYSSSDSSLLGCAEVEIVKPSDPQYDVIIAFPEDANFERVAFTKKLIEMASLGDSLDPTDLLILHEEVGTIESDTNCALAQLKITASSVEEANTYAMALQTSVCEELADNGCMTRVPNYNSLCNVASGALQIVASALSIILLLATLAMIQLF